MRSTSRADHLAYPDFPWYQDTTQAPPAATRKPELWEKAIETWLEAMPTYQPRFVHRDFHPGTVLWTRRDLSGVVDWACGHAPRRGAA